MNGSTTFIILIFSISTLSFFSCKKDEPEVVEEIELADFRDNIVGEYQMHYVGHYEDGTAVPSHFDTNYIATLNYGIGGDEVGIELPNGDFFYIHYTSTFGVLTFCPAASQSLEPAPHYIGQWNYTSVYINEDLGYCTFAPPQVSYYRSFSGSKL